MPIKKPDKYATCKIEKSAVPMEMIGKKCIKLHCGHTFGNDKILANRHNRKAYGVSFG